MQETVSNASWFRNTNAASHRRYLCGLLLVGEVSIPSSDDVAVHLSVFKVAAFKCINLPFQVHQRFLKWTEHTSSKWDKARNMNAKLLFSTDNILKKPNNCVSKLCNTKCVTCFNWTPAYRFLFAHPSHTTWTKRAVAGRIVAKSMLTSRLKVSTKTRVRLYPSTYIFTEMHKGDVNCWTRCCSSKNCHSLVQLTGASANLQRQTTTGVSNC